MAAVDHYTPVLPLLFSFKSFIKSEMAGLTNRKSDIKRWVSHLDTNPLFPKNETNIPSYSLCLQYSLSISRKFILTELLSIVLGTGRSDLCAKIMFFLLKIHIKSIHQHH